MMSAAVFVTVVLELLDALVLYERYSVESRMVYKHLDSYCITLIGALMASITCLMREGLLKKGARQILQGLVGRKLTNTTTVEDMQPQNQVEHHHFEMLENIFWKRDKH